MIQIQLMDKKVILAPVCIIFMNLGQIIIENDKIGQKSPICIFKQNQKIRAQTRFEQNLGFCHSVYMLNNNFF